MSIAGLRTKVGRVAAQVLKCILFSSMNRTVTTLGTLVLSLVHTLDPLFPSGVPFAAAEFNVCATGAPSPPLELELLVALA